MPKLGWLVADTEGATVACSAWIEGENVALFRRGCIRAVARAVDIAFADVAADAVPVLLGPLDRVGIRATRSCFSLAKRARIPEGTQALYNKPAFWSKTQACVAEARTPKAFCALYAFTFS